MRISLLFAIRAEMPIPPQPQLELVVSVVTRLPQLPCTGNISCHSIDLAEQLREALWSGATEYADSRFVNADR